MGLFSWIAKLLGFGPLTSRGEEERDFPLYLTRLEDRQVLAGTTLAISPANVTHAEGNTGTTPSTAFTFTVTRSDTSGCR